MLNKFVANSDYSTMPLCVHATFSQRLRDWSIRKLAVQLTSVVKHHSESQHHLQWCLERSTTAACGKSFGIQQLVFCCMSAGRQCLTSSWTQSHSPVSHRHQVIIITIVIITTTTVTLTFKHHSQTVNSLCRLEKNNNTVSLLQNCDCKLLYNCQLTVRSK